MRDGTLSQSRVDEALTRVITLKRRLLANPLPALDRIGAPEHEAFTPYLQKAAVARGCAG